MISNNLRLSRRLPAYASLAIATAVLMACGGGDTAAAGGSATSDSKTAFSAGPITGFGSVIVNGVRFDDSAAQVSDDDGTAHVRGDMKLGMVVEVEGTESPSDDNPQRHGAAQAIVLRSEVVGSVSSVDRAAGTLVVLGQTVDVTATTVFDDRLPSGLAGLSVGDVVEVYGTLDVATGQYTATRVEPRSNAAAFKLRGPVSHLDTSAKTFQIGNAIVSYAGVAASLVPSGMANGLFVRVTLQTQPQAGVWKATRLQGTTGRVDDHGAARIEGRVTAFTSPAQFSVDGKAVDGSAAVFSPDSGGLALGARVEVEGSAVNGVVVATRVSVKTEEEARHGQFELHGAIDTLDTAAKTFTLRGLTVEFGAPGVQFKDGAAGNLAVGRQVEVKGTLSATGTHVVAATVSFER